MGKLSRTDFVTLLDLVTKIDSEQRVDLQEFMAMEISGQNLVLKFVTKSIVPRSLNDGQYLETPTHNTAGEKKIGRGSKPGVKRGPYNTTGKTKTGRAISKKLEIIAPKGCKMDTPILFSMKNFEKHLKDSGLASATLYMQSVRKMMKDHGLLSLPTISLLSLRVLRDRYSGPDKGHMNKRTQLKRFNSYLIYEFEQHEKVS